MLWSLIGSPIVTQLAYINSVWGSATRTMIYYQQSRSGSVCTDLDGNVVSYSAYMEKGGHPLMQATPPYAHSRLPGPSLTLRTRARMLRGTPLRGGACDGTPPCLPRRGWA